MFAVRLTTVTQLDMIVIGGENVYSAEPEQAVSARAASRPRFVSAARGMQPVLQQ
jgi:hypothetical protein